MVIHTTIKKSLIILNHSRSKTRRNKMSTSRSWYTVSNLCSYGEIFNNCLLTLIMRLSNGRIYTLILFSFIIIYWKFNIILINYSYIWAFYLDLSGSVMFPNNSRDSMPTVYLTFRHTWLTYRRTYTIGDMQYYLACTSTFGDHVSS
jgi:hypothetical protein